MIKFTKEVLVLKSFSMTIEDFMANEFAHCDFDYNDDSIIVVYVYSGESDGRVKWAFDMPILSGKSIMDNYDIAIMIQSHFGMLEE